MKRFFCLVLTFTFMQNLYSWTSSHEHALKELTKLVPFMGKLSASQKEALYEKYYLYPDSHQQLNVEDLGEDEVAYLRERKIYNTLSFHQSDALPHMYYLLVEALKVKDYNKAIIWIACISHNLNDAASPHFLPSINFLSFCNQKFKLKGPKGELASHADTGSLYMDIAFATE